MAVFKIERVGGLAGFGGPGARIASRGELAASALSAEEHSAVEALFKRHATGKTGSRAAPPVADGFRYRISRTGAQGAETIEVPESDVPAALVRCVKDELL